jgi:hypothetical protein
MRTFIGVLLVGAVMAQVSTANAETEVVRFAAHNSFLMATSNEPDTGTTRSVMVTRELNQPGGPVYRVFYIVSNFDIGLFMLGSGLIDAQDVRITPGSASVDVDINAITLDFQIGDLPEDGRISIQWEATDEAQRISGGSFELHPGLRFNFVGTSLSAPADITGSVFGVDLVDPFGDIRILSSATIRITRQ